MAETKITPFRHFHKQMRFLFSLAILPVLHYLCCNSSVISNTILYILAFNNLHDGKSDALTF